MRKSERPGAEPDGESAQAPRAVAAAPRESAPLAPGLLQARPDPAPRLRHSGCPPPPRAARGPAARAQGKGKERGDERPRERSDEEHRPGKGARTQAGRGCIAELPPRRKKCPIEAPGRPPAGKRGTRGLRTVAERPDRRRTAWGKRGRGPTEGCLPALNREFRGTEPVGAGCGPGLEGRLSEAVSGGGEMAGPARAGLRGGRSGGGAATRGRRAPVLGCPSRTGTTPTAGQL